MYFYRALKKTEPTTISPVTVNEELVDLVYSNSMPSRSLKKQSRQIWSFAKTPEAALTWITSPRGKGEYDRLAYCELHIDDGVILDITDIKTWISLIERSNNHLMIKNLNTDQSIEAVRSIIPCSKSAISMARACQEVVFIPSNTVKLYVADNINAIPRNSSDTENVINNLSYSAEIIDQLLDQLNKYNIRPTLKNALIKLKAS